MQHRCLRPDIQIHSRLHDVHKSSDPCRIPLYRDFTASLQSRLACPNYVQGINGAHGERWRTKEFSVHASIITAPARKQGMLHLPSTTHLHADLTCRPLAIFWGLVACIFSWAYPGSPSYCLESALQLPARRCTRQSQTPHMARTELLLSHVTEFNCLRSPLPARECVTVERSMRNMLANRCWQLSGSGPS